MSAAESEAAPAREAAGKEGGENPTEDPFDVSVTWKDLLSYCEMQGV